MSLSWLRRNRRPLLRWGVFALALAGFGWTLFAWLPPEPRWVVRGPFAALGLASGGETFGTATRLPADLPRRLEPRFGVKRPKSGPAQFWDVETGREVLSVLGDGGPRWTIAFSDDGKRLGALASRSPDLGDELVSIDLVTRREARTTIEHRPESCELTISPNGALFRLDYENERQKTTPLFVYDADSLRLLKKVPDNRWPHASIADDGSTMLLYSLEQGGNTTLRRITRDGEVVTKFKGAGEWLMVSLDGNMLATEPPRADADDSEPIDSILLWELETGKPVGSIPVPAFHPRSSSGKPMRITSDSKTLIIAHGMPGPGDKVGVWDVDAAQWLGEARIEPDRVLYFPMQNAFASLGEKGAAHLDWFRARPFGKRWQRDWPGLELGRVALVPGSDRLAALTIDHARRLVRVQLLDLATGGIYFDVSTAVTDYDKWIARGARLALNEWHLEKKERNPILEFVEHRLLRVFFASLSPAEGTPTTTRVFDVEAGTELCRIDLPEADVYDFTPDGRLLFLYQTAGSSGEATLSCYDVPQRRSWAWIVGIPLTVGLSAVSLRAGWRRLRRSSAPTVDAAAPKIGPP
jgi:hypothetical protein